MNPPINRPTPPPTFRRPLRFRAHAGLSLAVHLPGQPAIRVALEESDAGTTRLVLRLPVDARVEREGRTTSEREAREAREGGSLPLLGGREGEGRTDRRPGAGEPVAGRTGPNSGIAAGDEEVGYRPTPRHAPMLRRTTR